MPIFYHRTHKRLAPDILREGIRTGVEVNKGECLPFVMATVDEYPVSTGFTAVIAFEIAADDPRLCYVNRNWIEYHANVPVSAIRAVSFPPSHNHHVVDLLDVCNWDQTDERYKRVWRYVAINDPLLDQLMLEYMP